MNPVDKYGIDVALEKLMSKMRTRMLRTYLNSSPMEWFIISKELESVNPYYLEWTYKTFGV